MEALNGGTMWNTSITVDRWIPNGYIYGGMVEFLCFMEV
jgi:hypothetical protein